MARFFSSHNPPFTPEWGGTAYLAARAIRQGNPAVAECQMALVLGLDDLQVRP